MVCCQVCTVQGQGLPELWRARSEGSRVAFDENRDVGEDSREISNVPQDAVCLTRVCEGRRWEVSRLAGHEIQRSDDLDFAIPQIDAEISMTLDLHDFLDEFGTHTDWIQRASARNLVHGKGALNVSDLVTH